jgi:hypothetical protein
LDTNILSALFYFGASKFARQQHLKTSEWWALERFYFDVYTSNNTELELSAGTYKSQIEALRAVRRIPYLPETKAVRTYAAMYINHRLVPSTKPGDAVQLAVASVHRIDYLFSWNHAHLVNARVQEALNALNRRMGLRTPLLVSPESIPWVNLGQDIRRNNA